MFKRIVLEGKAKAQAILNLKRQMAFIDQHGGFPGAWRTTEIRALLDEYDTVCAKLAEWERKPLCYQCGQGVQ